MASKNLLHTLRLSDTHVSRTLAPVPKYLDRYFSRLQAE